MIDIVLETLPNYEGLELPKYKTSGSSGFDLRAAVDKDVVISPGEWVLIPTGLKVELPTDYEIQIRSRSGIALDSGVIVLNTPGTIDDDYRGEIGVILINLGKKDFVVERGMRVAQGVLSYVPKANFRLGEVRQTGRGSGGYGHTGVK